MTQASKVGALTEKQQTGRSVVTAVTYTPSFYFLANKLFSILKVTFYVLYTINDKANNSN